MKQGIKKDGGGLFTQASIKRDQYEKKFLIFIALISVYLAFFSIEGIQVPIGNYWWDYFMMKGLVVQLFESPMPLVEQWVPFILPPAILKLASILSTLGPDYFVAHGLIALATFIMSYRAVFRQYPVKYSILLYSFLLIFSLIPVVIDERTYFSFKDANAIAYHGFYNRYLDIIFCALVFSLMAFLKNTNKWKQHVGFWSYCLIVSLLTKLSYFLAIEGLFLAFGIAQRNRSLLAVFGMGLIGYFLVQLFLPNYVGTIFEIAKVRGFYLSGYQFSSVILAFLVTGLIAWNLPETLRRLSIIPVPLLVAIGLGLGNYGDLSPLRWAAGVVFAVWSVFEFRNHESRFDFLRKDQMNKPGNPSLFKLVLAVSLSTILLLPVGVLLKTGFVTSAMMFYRMDDSEDSKGRDFISYQKLPNFFSHRLYLDKTVRNEADLDEFSNSAKVFDTLEQKRKLHTAGFFALYAKQLDDSIAKMSLFSHSKVGWFSVPGYVPQVLGVGRFPDGGRPWYVYSHEIDENHHPDFSRISQTSDIVVVDECAWGSWKVLVTVFKEDIYQKNRLIYKNTCFSVYADDSRFVSLSSIE